MQSDEIAAWYKNCTDDRVHILAYGNEGEDSVRYLIYLPGLRDTHEIDFDNNEGFFRNILDIEYDIKGRGTEEYLLLVTCIGNDTAKKLQITRDDKKLDCVMESTITEIMMSEDAVMVAAEHYSGGGRNGAVYVRPEEVPTKVAGE